MNAHIVAENTEFWVRDGRISSAPVDGAEEIRGGYAIAGLVDCHSHSTFDLSGRGVLAGTPEAVATNMRDYFAAGVTAVRDTGGVSMAAVEARDPRLIAGGRFIAPPGRYFVNWNPVPATDEQLVEAAREQAASGSPWVKIVDDWFSPETGRVEQHYEPATIAAAVSAVHEAGARVAMHCMDTASVEAAILGGIDSIEHGCNMTESQLERIATAGIAWCPTILLVGGFMSAQELPDAEYQARARRFYDEDLFTLLPRAASLGVTILAGSDTIPPARFWQEVATLHQYGLDGAAALDAATTAARAYLGLPDIADGSPADVVIYDSDPRNDPTTLARPSLVMVAGEIIATH